MKYVQSKQQKHQNDAIYVVLVFLLLTLTISSHPFLVFLLLLMLMLNKLMLAAKNTYKREFVLKFRF